MFRLPGVFQSHYIHEIPGQDLAIHRNLFCDNSFHDALLLCHRYVNTKKINKYTIHQFISSFVSYYWSAYTWIDYLMEFTCDQSPGTHLKGHGCLLHFCLVFGFPAFLSFINGLLFPFRLLRRRFPKFFILLLASANTHLKSSAASPFSSLIFKHTTWRNDSPRSHDLEHWKCDM